MIEAWERLRARGPSWFWLAHGMKNGDFYHACTLATAFRETYGTDLPIRIVVASRALMDVAALFGDQFAEVLHMGEFSEPATAWRAFFRETGLPALGPDTPILLHPLTNPVTAAMGGFVAETGLTWMALYRHVLGLAGDARVTPPAKQPSLAAAAADLCIQAGMPRGRAAILFPYAQSFPVSAIEHFARLAERMRERGLAVFTSIAHDEAPVPGTTPIAIPFSLLPDVVEHAGWAVAIRSGICDILAATNARKSFIFRNGRELPLWGLASMNLCYDAAEIPFDFPTRSPDDFADVVLAGDAPPPPVPGRRGISAEIAASRCFSFTTVQRDPACAARWAEDIAGSLRAPPVATRLVDIPERSHASWAPLLRDTLEQVVERSRDLDLSFHACRDHNGFDGFQPLLPETLVGGDYPAADDFHTIVVTAGAALADILPAGSRRRVMPAKTIVPGHRIDLAQGWGGEDVRDYGDGFRPLTLAGLSLLDGWYEPEPWGLWSRGCRCRLGFAIAEPAEGALTLRLGLTVAISPAYPELEMSVEVNRAAVATIALRDAHATLDVPVPEHVARGARQFLVTLRFARVRSPTEQGTGPDGRMLGIGLRWAELVASETVHPTAQEAST